MSRAHSAIALFSGGLDSLLAVKWMQKLGYRIEPIFFRTPFFPETRAVATAKANGINIHVIDISNVHLEMLQRPVYGFGKNFNPCIDCHALMFRLAGDLLSEYKCDFLISGEVIGQRPMSQRRDAMGAVSKLSGYKDLLIRPLCQKHLPDTLPIREGWIDKEEMLDINGRSRKPQVALAEELGVVNFPSSAGGCALTDVNYAGRLRDLMQYNALHLDDIRLLSYGRHFRLNERVKLIIGRDEADNNALQSLHIADYYLIAEEIMGPLGIIKGKDITHEDIKQAAAIVASYYKKASSPVTIEYGREFPLTDKLVTAKADEKLVRELMIQEHK